MSGHTQLGEGLTGAGGRKACRGADWPVLPMGPLLMVSVGVLVISSCWLVTMHHHASPCRSQEVAPQVPVIEGKGVHRRGRNTARQPGGEAEGRGAWWSHRRCLGLGSSLSCGG